MRPRLISSTAIFACALVFASARECRASVLKGVLINRTGESLTKVDFKVNPVGGIVPPIIGTDPATGQPITGTPVTIDPETSGLDPDNVTVAVGNGPDVQGLRLIFGQTQVIGADGQVSFQPVIGPHGEPPRYFENNGQLSFTLTSQNNDLQGLILDPTLGAKGLVYYAVVTNDDSLLGTGGLGSLGAPGSNVGSEVQTPEPISMALWSIIAGAGVLRSRRWRARQTA